MAFYSASPVSFCLLDNIQGPHVQLGPSCMQSDSGCSVPGLINLWHVPAGLSAPLTGAMSILESWGQTAACVLKTAVSTGVEIKVEQLECLCSEYNPSCPMITHTIDLYWIPVRTRQSQSYIYKQFVKIYIFLISTKRYTHNAHLLKLCDNMCKYEMDLASVVEDIELTRFCPQMDGQSDGQNETSIPPFDFVEMGQADNAAKPSVKHTT